MFNKKEETPPPQVIIPKRHNVEVTDLMVTFRFKSGRKVKETIQEFLGSSFWGYTQMGLGPKGINITNGNEHLRWFLSNWKQAEWILINEHLIRFEDLIGATIKSSIRQTAVTEKDS